MRFWKKVVLGVGAAVCALGTLVYAFVSVADGMCGNTVLSQHISPDGRLRVVVFERNCGATTGFSTQISMLKGSEPLENEAGNVFVGDTDHGAAPAGPGGGPRVDVRWTSGRSLELKHHPLTRVFRAAQSVKGVSVKYVVVDDSGR